MTTTKYSDYGRLFSTDQRDGHDFEYYIDDKTKKVMILQDGQPILDEPVYVNDLIQHYSGLVLKHDKTA